VQITVLFANVMEFKVCGFALATLLLVDIELKFLLSKPTSYSSKSIDAPSAVSSEPSSKP